MRISLLGPAARTAALLALCLATSKYQLSVAATSALLAAWLLVSAYLFRTRDCRGASVTMGAKAPRKRFLLDAMPVSHFTEKVRWTLDLLGLPYTEEDSVGILGFMALGRSVPRLEDRATSSTIGNSDECIHYLSGILAPEAQEDARVAAFLRRTPGDKPEATMGWEADLNLFGHMIQRYCYSRLLDPAQCSGKVCRTFWGCYEPLVPLWQRLILRTGYPVARKFMIKAMKLDKARPVEVALERIRSTLDAVDAALHANRAKRASWKQSAASARGIGERGPVTSHMVYLTGDGSTMSYVDVTFASLAAVLMPLHVLPRMDGDDDDDDGGTSQLGTENNALPSYAGGRYASFLEMGARVRSGETKYPKELLELGNEMARRPCGKFVVDMYQAWRAQTLPVTGAVTSKE